MTDFLDLLEALHHGCVSGDRTRLAHCQAWLETVVALPRNETGWHQLGTGPVDWLTPLPIGWEPQWRIVSPRERTLTVGALEYLDTHPPGAVWRRRCLRLQPLRPRHRRFGTFPCTGV